MNTATAIVETHRLKMSSVCQSFQRYFSLDNITIHFQSFFLAKLVLLGIFMLGCTSLLVAQFVSPNQAGRKGGDTGAGIGNQVVTSTYYGNAGNTVAQGVIMSVNKDGSNASSFHDFDGYPGDGSYPWYTTPHQGSNGKLYGVTYIGGTSNWGTIYDYDFQNCAENVIYNSGPGPTGGAGSGNFANLNELSDGMLYCILTYGGSQAGGKLFRMNKDGSGFQTVHDFHELNTVNYSPAANNTTLTGGQNVIGPFAGKDGMWPLGFVVEGPDGKIYGTTQDGGSYSWGTVYRCDKDGSNYQVIYSGDPTVRSSYYKKADGTTVSLFTENHHWIHGNVAFDASGKVYFNGFYGGYADLGGCSRMNTDGTGYEYVVLPLAAADGYTPYRGPLIIDNQVYGTFRFGGGGVAPAGVVWKADLNGQNFTKLKSFNAPSGAYTDGYDPWAGLSYDGTNLFGTCVFGGGVGSAGTIFKLNTDGTNFQTIYRFSGTAATPSSACAPGKTGLFSYYPGVERLTFANVQLNCSLTCISNPAPCTAGSTAPSVLATTVKNTCPLKTADLTSTVGSGTVTWHTGTPATDANRVSDPTKVTNGTYYAALYDATNSCYSTSTSAAVTVTIDYVCSQKVVISSPPGSTGTGAFTTPINTPKTGNTSTDLTPTGGTPAYQYTSVDCGSGSASTTSTQGGTITVNPTTGAYTYTPATGFTGNDTFCIQVCDSATPTPNCTTANYFITVTPAACNANGKTPN